MHVLHAAAHVLLLDGGRLLLAGPPAALHSSSHPLAASFRAAGTPEPEAEPEAEAEPKREPEAVSKTSSKKDGKGGKLTVKEDRTAGAVTLATYQTYVRAAGGGCARTLLVATLFVLGQLAFLSGDLWLAGWADRNARLQTGAPGPGNDTDIAGLPCEISAERCACGPVDLSGMRGRIFRTPMEADGFVVQFSVCDEIAIGVRPYTCQASDFVGAEGDLAEAEAVAAVPHPAALVYRYATDECAMIGSLGPCDDEAGVSCGVRYQLLPDGAVAVTFRYATGFAAPAWWRRLEEEEVRPDSCAGSFRIVLSPGTESMPGVARRLPSRENAEDWTAAGWTASAPRSRDRKPAAEWACRDWTLDWAVLGVYGPTQSRAPSMTALATDLATALGLGTDDALGAGDWMRGYGAITVLALVLAVSRSVSFVWMALAAARGLHNRMAATILHAPMRFFEENPQGRLLNRFAADLDKVDSLLPTVAGDTLRLFCTVMGAVGVCLALLPPLVLVLFPCWYLFRRIQRYYLKSSRELARLEAMARSPLYSLFTASLCVAISYRPMPLACTDRPWLARAGTGCRRSARRGCSPSSRSASRRCSSATTGRTGSGWRAGAGWPCASTASRTLSSPRRRRWCW